MKIIVRISLGILITFTIFLFFEITLKVGNFSYFPPGIGFEITKDFNFFRKDAEYYRFRHAKSKRFLIVKPETTYRIFILGGSSVKNLSNMEYLSNKLNQVAENKNIDIINLGVPAWGTNRILLLFQEILDFQADLMIIYSGHNEFEEHFIEENFIFDNVLSDFHDRLIEKFKIYQFMNFILINTMEFISKNIVELIKYKRSIFFTPKLNLIQIDAHPSVPFDKEEIYRNYEFNIKQIVKMAKNKKLKIMLCTVAFNRWAKPYFSDNAYYSLARKFVDINKYEKAFMAFNEVVEKDKRPKRASNTSNNIIKKIASNMIYR